MHTHCKLIHRYVILNTKIDALAARNEVEKAGRIVEQQQHGRGIRTVLVLKTRDGASTRSALLVHDMVCDVDVLAVTVNSASQLYL